MRGSIVAGSQSCHLSKHALHKHLSSSSSCARARAVVGGTYSIGHFLSVSDGVCLLEIGPARRPPKISRWAFPFETHGGARARTPGEQFGRNFGTLRSDSGTLLPFRADIETSHWCDVVAKTLISWAFLATTEHSVVCATDARCAHGPARYPCRAPLRPLSQTAPPTGSTPAGLQFRGAVACGQPACRRSVDQGIP